MPTFVSRARLGAFVGLLAFSPLAASQNVEIYAGGAKFRNTPGQQVPVIPSTVTIGPDGMVYVSDAVKGRLIRFDPATGTATALPGLDPQPPENYAPPDFEFTADALAMNPAGELFGATWQQMFRIDLQEGTREFLTGDEWSTGTSSQMTFDPDGNLYYLKRDNAIYSATNLFRRSPWGYTEWLAQGYDNNFHGDGGPLAWAGISHARGVALDAQGNLYLADTSTNRVRKITANNGVIDPETSIITTVAGNGQWYSNDENVPATSTGLASPEALAIDAAGNLYIHERGMNRVRRVSAADGTISTYAGGGPWGYSGDGGPAAEAHIDLVNGNIILDAASNLYLAEMGSNRLRRVNAATGTIETVLGNGTMTFCREVSPRREACLGGPQGVAVDAGGNVYISDSRNLRIRRIDAVTGELRTIAGTGFSYTHDGDGGPATAASFATDPAGISFDPAGNLLIAGGWANNVRRIDTATGIITTIAGTGIQGFAGDGGPATAARFAGVHDVVADSAGNLYLSDSFNYRIRKISAAGIVSTIAGNGTNAFSGDGGLATAASLQWATDIRIDAAGNVLFADNARIRRIDAATGIITTVAGNGGSWGTGEGVPATSVGIGWSFAFDLDLSGNIVINTGNYLRRVDATTGLITSVGSPYGMNAPEGTTIQSAAAMKFGPQGLFVTDDNTDLVFRIDGVPNNGPDTTAPEITYVLNGAAGVEGWYRSDVALTWTVSDPESPLLSSSGCSDRTIIEDTAGVTFTCAAASVGGETSRSVTIRRDTVAPVVTQVGIDPAAPDSLGWYNREIQVLLWSNDTLSGVYSGPAVGPLLIQQEGTGVTGQVVVTDRAGNSTTYTSPAFNLDLYPPAIASGWMSPQGNDNWHISDVQVDWEIYEPISPIRSSEGCDDFTVSTDTPGLTFTCTATSAGGTMTSTRTLKRDATPPTLVFGPPSPAPNASGWHNGDVSFSFTTSDGTSGVASTSSSGPVVITGEGTGLTATVTVTDAAGNSASFTTPPVNIDRTPPTTVTPVIAGTLGNEGWYTSNVQVSWITTGNIISSTGCGPGSVTTDTAAVTFTCSATSASGTVSNSVTVKRDATPPVLTWRAATPNANAAGWNRTNVNFPFDPPTDARSGIASVSSTSPLVVSAEGTGVTGSVTVTDRAGNVAVFTTAPRNIDKTAPTVNVRTPLHNRMYGLYSTLVADYDCTDAGSGTTSCSGTLANGATLNTRSMNGSYTFRVTSNDVAGNSVTKSNVWSVAGSFIFDGYLAPMRNDPTYNLVTAGTRVPMRFRLPDRNGGFVSDMTAFQSFTVNSERCISSSVPLNDVATGNAGLSFDPATSTFTYNWDTNAGWAGTCRNVVVRLVDGSRHTLFFKFQ
ncbi:MAG TPA: PxKF domain-containing protein [Steroidobacteraceae bacterium]|nr:PxKF domain-containing protein [Steroidobacteraceae bacterium]